VIEAENGSHIYAGLRPGTTAGNLRQSLDDGNRCGPPCEHVPKPGDAVFIPGERFTLWATMSWFFEVQQNSDTTFRLYDWGHIDPETKEPRALQVDEALACIKFGESNSGLTAPRVETTSPVERERLFDCHAFLVWRVLGQDPFTVGATAEPRVLVGIKGSGRILHNGTPYAVGKGDVWLLPAEAGECAFQPRGEIALLEIAIP